MNDINFQIPEKMQKKKAFNALTLIGLTFLFKFDWNYTTLIFFLPRMAKPGKKKKKKKK